MGMMISQVVSSMAGLKRRFELLWEGWKKPENCGRRGKRLKIERRYSKIADNYSSLEQVTDALAQAGLESSNLIVGIDFTKSNEWTGKKSFSNCSLHKIGDNIQNPYEHAISIIGQTLSGFDDDNQIPCFGFGDASTHDQDVFSFYQDFRPCNGFSEAVSRYREIVPHLHLSGPTSFAPVIEMAMTIVEQSGGQYHVLLIIADGQFVNFTEIMSKDVPQNRKETEFALSALMEIPSQYKATIELGILGHCVEKSPKRISLPSPIRTHGAKLNTAALHETSSSSDRVCIVCLTNRKDVAFECGHQACYECGRRLSSCPLCRRPIYKRLKLY